MKLAWQVRALADHMDKVSNVANDLQSVAQDDDREELSLLLAELVDDSTASARELRRLVLVPVPDAA